MNEQNKITINYGRERKINPRLIHPNFEYGSETIVFSLWEQIDKDQDRQAAIDELKATVNAEIEKELQETVERLRRISRASQYNILAIESAFYELMKSQNLPDDEIKIAFDRFTEILKLTQAQNSY